MVMPEEQAHAILLKVADDVRQWDKNHKQWRLVLLSVPVYIDVFPKEEQVQLAAHNARQLIFQYHWIMALSAQQQCYDVVVVNNTLQKTLGRLPTRKEINGTFHWNTNLTDGRQEGYIEDFVKYTMTIYARI